MYFLQAIAYPFEGKDSIRIASIFGVLFLIPIINLFAFVVGLGYMLRLVPRIYDGIKDKPDIEFGPDFSRGITVLLAMMIYNVVPLLLAVPMVLVAFQADIASLWIVVGAGVVGLYIWINLAYSIGFVRYALNPDLGVLFDIAGNGLRPFIRLDATAVVLFNWFWFTLITQFAIFSGYSTCCLPGIIMAGAWGVMGTYYLAVRYGQALHIEPTAAYSTFNQPTDDYFMG